MRIIAYNDYILIFHKMERFNI